MADAATSVIHAQNIVISILVIVALLGTVAFPLFVVQVFRVVLRRIMLEARIYEKVPLRRFLYPLQSKRWVRMAWTMMVENAYLMLWWLTFVGGIIKTYSYFLVPYIVAENPNISANQAISLSRRMMKGHKWECFVAQVSFLGWYLLNGATVGLSESSIPMVTTRRSSPNTMRICALWPRRTALRAQGHSSCKNPAISGAGP